MIEDPTKPKGPSLELTLAKQANEAIENGADPHAATDMLGKMLTHLKQNPTVAQQGSEALAAGADPHAVSSKVWELANGKPMVSGGVAPQDKQFAALVGQGASLGFGAKILGGIDAVNKMLPRALGGENAPASDFGKNYAATRDLVRNTAAEGIEAHPVAGRAVEALSGVATSLPALAGGAVAKAPLLVRSLRSAATGAGFGAAASAGNATGGPADYAKQIGTGAASGAVIGGALPSLAEGASYIGGKALTAAGLRPSGRTAEEIAADAAAIHAPQGPQAQPNAPTMQSVANGVPVGNSAPPTQLQTIRAATGRVAQGAGIESAKTRALREVARRFELDNVTPADATDYAARAGNKPVAVLDLGGGNVGGLARTAKDVPSLARRQIPEFLNTRSAGTTGNEGATLGRITSDFENRIGLAPEDYFKSADDMTAAMKKRAASDYGKIRNTVVDDPDALALFNEPEFRAVHEKVRANARIGMREKIPPLTTKETVGGEEVTTQNPQTLGTLDKVKRQLDAIISGKSEAVGPVDRDMAHSMRARLNEILDTIDKQVPDYGAARSQYRGSAEAIDAFQKGKDEFMSTDPRLLQRNLEQLPDRLKDLYRRGAYDALRSRLVKMKDGANIGGWLEDNPDIRDRVAALSKNPGDASALRGDLGVERAMGDRKNMILGGPNTAERMIDHEHTKPLVTTLGNIARKVPVLGHATGGLIDNALTRRTAEQTGDVMGEVGKIMTRSGLGGIQQTFDDIARLNASDAEKKMLREAIAKAFAQAGPRANPQKQN